MPSESTQANALTSATVDGVIAWTSAGLGAPAFTTSSAGERLRLRNTLSGSAANFAIGVETGYLWIGTDSASTTKGVKIYAGVTQMFKLVDQVLTIFSSPSNKVMVVQQTDAIGDIPTGVYCSSQSTGSISLVPSSDAGSASAKAAIVAFNGSAWRSMFETQNVASGEPNALLAKSGGSVGIGTSAPLCRLHALVGTSYAGGAPSTAGFALTDTAVDGTARALKFGLNAAGGYAAIQSTLEGTDNLSLALNPGLSTTAPNVLVGATSGLTGSALDVNGLVRFRGGEVLSGVTRRTSGASYTMVTGDRLVVFASGSSGAFNLIASPETGRVVDVRNDSGGDITLTPAAGNINGAGTLALPTGTGWCLRYDGTQWITFG